MTKLKRFFHFVFLNFYLLTISFSSFSQSVGINATGATPDPSSLLDLSSTNKGFLITRVDTASIATPAFGLMTLAPSDSCLYMYSGINWINMGGVGANCPCFCNTTPSTPALVFPCGGTVIPVIEVTNALTGKTWMDRNLGSSQVAASVTDVAAYGDLYQWGRCSDGHEKRTSTTTTTLSLTDTPGNGNHILAPVAPFDWRSGQNVNLWQGISGINNPCPTGYRIPTETEWNAERLTWTTNNAAGAWSSPLKLTLGGYHTHTALIPGGVGSSGRYWTSTITGTTSKYLSFTATAGSISPLYRAYGMSIRCIKE